MGAVNGLDLAMFPKTVMKGQYSLSEGALVWSLLQCEHAVHSTFVYALLAAMPFPMFLGTAFPDGAK